MEGVGDGGGSASGSYAGGGAASSGFMAILLLSLIGLVALVLWLMRRALGGHRRSSCGDCLRGSGATRCGASAGLGTMHHRAVGGRRTPSTQRWCGWWHHGEEAGGGHGRKPGFGSGGHVAAVKGPVAGVSLLTRIEALAMRARSGHRPVRTCDLDADLAYELDGELCFDSPPLHPRLSTQGAHHGAGSAGSWAVGCPLLASSVAPLRTSYSSPALSTPGGTVRTPSGDPPSGCMRSHSAIHGPAYPSPGAAHRLNGAAHHPTAAACGRSQGGQRAGAPGCAGEGLGRTSSATSLPRLFDDDF